MAPPKVARTAPGKTDGVHSRRLSHLAPRRTPLVWHPPAVANVMRQLHGGSPANGPPQGCSNGVWYPRQGLFPTKAKFGPPRRLWSGIPQRWRTRRFALPSRLWHFQSRLPLAGVHWFSIQGFCSPRGRWFSDPGPTVAGVAVGDLGQSGGIDKAPRLSSHYRWHFWHG